MAKKKKSSFFSEFKAFITRGNVVDMATGVIVAGAFTKIVTAFTNDIIMPIINFVFSLLGDGNNGPLISVLNGEAYLINDPAADAEALEAAGEKIPQVVNPECIYINWSSLIEAILNFLLIALIIFLIIKAINALHDKAEAMKAAKNEEEIRAAEAARIAAEEEAKVQAEAAAKAKLEADKAKIESASTNELLVEIINLLNK